MAVLMDLTAKPVGVGTARPELVLSRGGGGSSRSCGDAKTMAGVMGKMRQAQAQSGGWKQESRVGEMRERERERERGVSLVSTF